VIDSVARVFPAQRQKIVAAIYVAGASINEAA
jgi:hypothetical protein